ncbi:7074_t:CDS:2, partial [Paraglomus occultum]
NYASPKIYGPTYNRPNLLNQLIARDIHREKSAILQCFRHIITQNFFGVIPDSVIEESKRRGPSIVMYGNSSSDTESGTENENEIDCGRMQKK